MGVGRGVKFRNKMELECASFTLSFLSSCFQGSFESYQVLHVFCSIQSPCCGKEYPCRLCHDENESHKIDRHNISEIKCRKCFYEQPVSFWTLFIL